MDSHARDLEAFLKLLQHFPASRYALGYSSRSAVIGSTRVARFAGIQMAMKATALSKSGVAMKAIGIERFHAEEKAGQKTREPESAAGADHHAEQREHHSLADDHVAQIGSLRAKRHADAEFLRALLHGVGHNAIHADGRHEQAGGAEDGEQQHIEALARDVARLDLVHGANMRNRQAATGIAQSRGDWRDQGARIDLAANDPPERRTRELSAVSRSGICASGMYIIGDGSRFRPAIVRVAHDADNLARAFGKGWAGAGARSEMRSFSGSPFGQYWRAMASLMMTTPGAGASSCSVKARPRNSGILRALK